MLLKQEFSWVDLAHMRESGQAQDSVFVPKEGMRIPIDFSINDNDNPNDQREGILCYSPDNQDQSYSTTARWTYTWIGNKWTVGVNDHKSQLYTYQLAQNYPNPFNPTTTINYSIEKPGLVTIKIFDILGRQITELVNEVKNSGAYSVNFDASNLASGMYLYQINAGQFHSAKKMMLVK